MAIISKRGQNPAQGDMYTQMAKWKSWYRGNVNDFHTYNIKTTNGKTVSKKRLSLQMAKKVAEDWATMLWNEEVTMTIQNDERLNDMVQDVLEENNFRVEMGGLIEKSFALGTGALIEYASNGEVMLDYISGDLVIISSYRNQKVNGITTVNSFKRGEENVTHLTHRNYADGVYTVENEVYTSKDSSKLGKAVRLESVFEKNEVVEKVEFRTTTPHFQVIRPNIVNNYELENPLGMSIYGNSIDTLEAIDKKYDSFTNEFEAARHRIFLNSDATKMQQDIDEQGNLTYITYFDREQMEYQSVPMQDGESIKFYNAEIRTTQHNEAINRELQTLGFKCGMGTDYYAFDSRGVYQNEKAVVSENSDLWATKAKHEIVLAKVLRDCVKSIAFLLTGRDIETDDIEISLADSLIIDDEAEYIKDKELMEMSLMPEVDFLIKWRGLTEEEALDWIERANAGGNIQEMIIEDELPEDIDGDIEEIEEE